MRSRQDKAVDKYTTAKVRAHRCEVRISLPEIYSPREIANAKRQLKACKNRMVDAIHEC